MISIWPKAFTFCLKNGFPKKPDSLLRKKKTSTSTSRPQRQLQLRSPSPATSISFACTTRISLGRVSLFKPDAGTLISLFLCWTVCMERFKSTNFLVIFVWFWFLSLLGNWKSWSILILVSFPINVLDLRFFLKLFKINLLGIINLVYKENFRHAIVFYFVSISWDILGFGSSV